MCSNLGSIPRHKQRCHFPMVPTSAVRCKNLIIIVGAITRPKTRNPLQFIDKGHAIKDLIVFCVLLFICVKDIFFPLNFFLLKMLNSFEL